MFDTLAFDALAFGIGVWVQSADWIGRSPCGLWLCWECVWSDLICCGVIQRRNVESKEDFKLSTSESRVFSKDQLHGRLRGAERGLNLSFDSPSNNANNSTDTSRSIASGNIMIKDICHRVELNGQV